MTQHFSCCSVGDYLVVQSTQDNHFGAYVVTGLNLYKVDGVIIRELLVKVFNGDRAFGDVEYGDNCLCVFSVLVQ